MSSYVVASSLHPVLIPKNSVVPSFNQIVKPNCDILPSWKFIIKTQSIILFSWTWFTSSSEVVSKIHSKWMKASFLVLFLMIRIWIFVIRVMADLCWVLWMIIIFEKGSPSSTKEISLRQPILHPCRILEIILLNLPCLIGTNNQQPKYKSFHSYFLFI